MQECTVSGAGTCAFNSGGRGSKVCVLSVDVSMVPCSACACISDGATKGNDCAHTRTHARFAEGIRIDPQSSRTAPSPNVDLGFKPPLASILLYMSPGRNVRSSGAAGTYVRTYALSFQLRAKRRGGKRVFDVAVHVHVQAVRAISDRSYEDVD